MRVLTAAAILALLGGSATAQTSLTPPRASEQDFKDLNASILQRQQEALRQQQQAFDGFHRQFSAEREKSAPILPSDPNYLGTMFG